MRPKEATDKLSALLNELETQGFEFLPKEGMIYVLQWGKDKKLYTLGAIVEGSETSVNEWRFVPQIGVGD